VVHAHRDHLAVALRELVLELGSPAQLGGADRCEVLRVGKQDCPLLADPVVKLDAPFGGVLLEVGRDVADSNRHRWLLSSRESLEMRSAGPTQGQRAAAAAGSSEGGTRTAAPVNRPWRRSSRASLARASG